MSPKQKRRLWATCLILAGVGVATALAVSALTDNISYLYSPSSVVENELRPGTRFRLGGVVLEDSIERLGGLKVRFAVTDRVREHEVFYEGILPDLFREGQSVIAHGQLGGDGVFQADRILARHDETYMPAEVMAAMDQAQGRQAAGAYGAGKGGAAQDDAGPDAATDPAPGSSTDAGPVDAVRDGDEAGADDSAAAGGPQAAPAPASVPAERP